MRTFLILLLCTFVHSRLNRWSRNGTLGECLKKENIDEDTELQVRSSMHLKKFITDDLGMCAVKCYLLERGVLTPTGEANLTSRVELQEKLLANIDKCNGISHENSCEAAYQLQLCMNSMYTKSV